MDTSGKFSCRKTLLVINVKGLNTECWNPVLFSLYGERVRKNSVQKMNKGNKIGQ